MPAAIEMGSSTATAPATESTVADSSLDLSSATAPESAPKPDETRREIAEKASTPMFSEVDNGRRADGFLLAFCKGFQHKEWDSGSSEITTQSDLGEPINMQEHGLPAIEKSASNENDLVLRIPSQLEDEIEYAYLVDEKAGKVLSKHTIERTETGEIADFGSQDTIPGDATIVLEKNDGSRLHVSMSSIVSHQNLRRAAEAEKKAETADTA